MKIPNNEFRCSSPSRLPTDGPSRNIPPRRRSSSRSWTKMTHLRCSSTSRSKSTFPKTSRPTARSTHSSPLIRTMGTVDRLSMCNYATDKYRAVATASHAGGGGQRGVGHRPPKQNGSSSIGIVNDTGSFVESVFCSLISLPLTLITTISTSWLLIMLTFIAALSFVPMPMRFGADAIRLRAPRQTGIPLSSRWMRVQNGRDVPVVIGLVVNVTEWADPQIIPKSANTADAGVTLTYFTAYEQQPGDLMGTNYTYVKRAFYLF